MLGNIVYPLAWDSPAEQKQVANKVFFLPQTSTLDLATEASPEEILECSYSTADGTSMDVILGNFQRQRPMHFFLKPPRMAKQEQQI